MGDEKFCADVAANLAARIRELTARPPRWHDVTLNEADQ